MYRATLNQRLKYCWSELPVDLLVAVAECIHKLEDFIAFGAVCKGWFAVGKEKEYFKGLWLRQGTPYLMLPITEDNDDAREFYSLVEGEIVDYVTIPKFKERKCHESLGWLLAVENDGTMCLLNPFTSVEIPLPHQSTFPKYEYDYEMSAYVFVQKFVLSARPSETSDFIVTIVGGYYGCLAFWRLGDESWNKMGGQSGCEYSDVMYYGGHLYAIDNDGFVYVFTIEGDNPPNGKIVARLLVGHRTRLYILKTSESLLLISRTTSCIEKERTLYNNTSQFRVYKVYISTSTCTEINNVGSMAIFVGHNTTFTIDTCRSFEKIKGNYIYFTDDDFTYHYYDGKGGGKDMGVYSMETGTIESFYSGEVLLGKVCPPIWITPSF